MLLQLASGSNSTAVRKAALASLGHFDDPQIGGKIVAAYPLMPRDDGVRAAAVSVLCTRVVWATELLKGIRSDAIARADLTPDQVDRLRRFDDTSVVILAEKVLGPAARPSPKEKLAQIESLRTVLSGGAGDASAGKALFAARCSACHTLHGEGGHVGPDLTPYKRDNGNLDFLLVSIVDPSAAIREEYTAFLVETKDGQSLVGLITDRQTTQITVMDTGQRKTIVPVSQIKRQRAMPVSLMPEELLTGLSPAQLRDFFAYLQSPRPVSVVR